MSLVPVFVYASDGKYYKDPVIRGPGWFICFDDEEPPEVVIQIETGASIPHDAEALSMLKTLLVEKDVPFTNVRGVVRTTSRHFVDPLPGQSKIDRAITAFFDLTRPLPVELLEGCKPRKKGPTPCCVVYGNAALMRGA